jgi:hypothetical protein
LFLISQRRMPDHLVLVLIFCTTNWNINMIKAWREQTTYALNNIRNWVQSMVLAPEYYQGSLGLT